MCLAPMLHCCSTDCMNTTGLIPRPNQLLTLPPLLFVRSVCLTKADGCPVPLRPLAVLISLTWYIDLQPRSIGEVFGFEINATPEKNLENAEMDSQVNPSNMTVIPSVLEELNMLDWPSLCQSLHIYFRQHPLLLFSSNFNLLKWMCASSVSNEYYIILYYI